MKAKLPTGKSLGFAKGDFVLTELGFPGIIIGDVHRINPFLEVWGDSHEVGTAYARDLSRITSEKFVEIVMRNKRYTEIRPDTIVARKALGLSGKGNPELCGCGRAETVTTIEIHTVLGGEKFDEHRNICRDCEKESVAAFTILLRSFRD